ncbi:MAG TPA: proprotein convertase P-domain-containing protein, partial [Saprospiraceae bacterium]|nr:proprotein convertase P-domain-containing protein [Saprospiraceae bacterium]
MPDLFVGSFYINVQNASNPTLGQNGQGVCGVKIHFDHTAICDISMTLTSPSGQTVTLVAPIGQFCTTQGNAGTDWDVTFLPCGDPAVSPDPGFTDTWNNNQNWGGNNTYTGSYYPYAGCLQNFTGPVNGTWNLTVTDGQANDVGNLYNYEIIFCDPSGIECFSCAANAGFLPQNDVVLCEADPGLSLDLPPSYTPPLTAPPASDYSYAYVIGGAGGVIQAIQATPDLTAFPGGTYTVCGLSYLTANADDIPDPNGTLTVTQLTNQLNSTQPPFCGDVTTNCVGVTIKPVPPDVEEFIEICAPDCYNFFNQDFCQSGTYVLNLTLNGCPYVATLNLTVRQPNFVTVFETICAGDCSANPLFPYACNTGTYQETVDNIFGCDSTVTLNLAVINPIAVIQPPPILACGQPSAQLSGTGSSTGGGTTYLWTATNGGTIIGASNGLNVTIGTAGNYNLEVCRTFSGHTCCDTATVTVTADTSAPAMPANIIGDSTICLGLNGTYSIPAVPGATGYTWTVPAGVTIDTGQNTTSIVVKWDSLNVGNICVTANNACGVSPPGCRPITVDTVMIPAVPQGDTAVCVGDIQSYSVPALPDSTTYTWTVAAPAVLISGQGTNQIMVTWGNAPNGNVCVSATGACGASAQVCLPVSITATPSAPVVNGNAVVCAGNTETYTLAAIPGATGYNWQVTGGVIANGNGTTSVQVVWDINATGGTLCATAGNACGSSLPACLNITINPMLAAPVITGDATLCPGDIGAYSIVPVNGAGGYTWTVPPGGILVSGQNTTAIAVDWTAAPGGNVCVAANSGCG